MRSRTFLNVSLGILALAAAYHLGAQSAMAQAPGNPVVSFAAYTAAGNAAAAVTANGDIYTTSISNLDGAWLWKGNISGVRRFLHKASRSVA
jgi:hypothetical protein